MRILLLVYIYIYMILLVNLQISTITYTLKIFNYIHYYSTTPIYYHLTHNYVNVHKLSDHSLYLITSNLIM